MFDSDILDRLSRVHPDGPARHLRPGDLVAFTVGARGEPTTVQVVGLVLAGYVFWTLTEYWMHRLIFHFEPEEGSERGSTGSSTASTTTIRTTRSGS